MKQLAFIGHFKASGVLNENLAETIATWDIPDALATGIEDVELKLRIPGAGTDAEFSVSESIPLKVPVFGTLNEKGVESLEIQINDIPDVPTQAALV